MKGLERLINRQRNDPMETGENWDMRGRKGWEREKAEKWEGRVQQGMG